MKFDVVHWHTIIERDDVPKHKTILNIPEEEVGPLMIRLSAEFDVAIMHRGDPRTRKQKARNDPWRDTPILALDNLNGKFRQR